MLERLKNEPVLLLTLAQYLLALGVAFGLRLSTEQEAAIIAVVGLTLTLVTRQLVTPMRLVEPVEPVHIRFPRPPSLPSPREYVERKGPDDAA